MPLVSMLSVEVFPRSESFKTARNLIRKTTQTQKSHFSRYLSAGSSYFAKTSAQTRYTWSVLFRISPTLLVFCTLIWFQNVSDLNSYCFIIWWDKTKQDNTKSIRKEAKIAETFQICSCSILVKEKYLVNCF